MTPALFDQRGNRKYLIARERLAFVYAASNETEAISTFCLTLAFTGARISEVLALTHNRIDVADEVIIFETLKQRKRQVFRAVPVRRTLIPLLTKYGVGKEGRLWPWGRTNGWKVVKAVMRKAGIAQSLCKPKALRHAFAVEAGQKSIPLNIVLRWLGHAPHRNNGHIRQRHWGRRAQLGASSVEFVGVSDTRFNLTPPKDEFFRYSLAAFQSKHGSSYLRP